VFAVLFLAKKALFSFVSAFSTCENLFCSRSGEKKQISSSPDEEYERAQRAILDAVTTVEDHAQRLIAAEVDILFHGHEHSEVDKAKVTKKAQQAVKEATSKVKKSVQEKNQPEAYNVYPFENHPYPYAYPQINHKNRPMEHRDHRILHAVEVAEKAVLHAIENEVETLYHLKEEEQHKTTVKSGLKKAKAEIEEHHEKRRGWLDLHGDEKSIEEYTAPFMFLEK